MPLKDSNPYESSVRTPPDSLLIGVADVQNPKPQGRRFLLLSLGGGVVGFLSWCILDAVTVRVLPYPERVGDFDWTFCLFPIAFLGFAIWYFRSARTSDRV